MKRHNPLCNNFECKLFCPKQNCSYYLSLENEIIKDGTYSTKNDTERRQILLCKLGGHRFSETAYSPLFGKHGSFKEYEQVCKLSCLRLSSDEISDVIGKDVRTIGVWQQVMAKKANTFHNFICLNITLSVLFLQMDELWSYLKNKQRQLWVFIGFEVESRFWINFKLGSRTTNTATKRVKQMKQYFDFSKLLQPLKITTDKLAAYKNALETVFSKESYLYLQIVKQRIKKRLKTVKKCFVKGAEEDFQGKTQNTSYIERFNLTLRGRVAYLQRKTLGYCKKQANFETLLWLNLYDYNYRCYHKSLRIAVDLQKSQGRFQKNWNHQTPAMAMELSKEPLSWRFLFLVPIPLTA